MSKELPIPNHLILKTAADMVKQIRSKYHVTVKASMEVPGGIEVFVDDPSPMKDGRFRVVSECFLTRDIEGFTERQLADRLIGIVADCESRMDYRTRRREYEN